MLILSDHSLEYGVMKKNSNVFRFSSAIFGMVGVVSLIPAIAYSYYFFIAVGIGLALWLLFEELLKKGEYTIRILTDIEGIVVSKISLDGKENIIKKICYNEIERIKIVDLTEIDKAYETFIDENSINMLPVEIKHKDGRMILTMDKYMFSVVDDRMNTK